MVPRQDADPGTETTRAGEIEAKQTHQPDQGTIVKGSRDNISCLDSKIKTAVCWNLSYHREGLKQEVREAEVEDILGHLEPLPSQKGRSLAVSVCSTWGRPGFKKAKTDTPIPTWEMWEWEWGGHHTLSLLDKGQ